MTEAASGPEGEPVAVGYPSGYLRMLLDFARDGRLRWLATPCWATARALNAGQKKPDARATGPGEGMERPAPRFLPCDGLPFSMALITVA